MIQINFSIRDCLNPFGPPRPKTERTKDPAYVKFTAEHNPTCIVPGCGQPAQMDHAVGGRSRNSRCSDYLIFPNCAKHHIGRKKITLFEEEHGVNLPLFFIRNWQLYANHKGITGEFESFEDLQIAFKNHKHLRKAA